MGLQARPSLPIAFAIIGICKIIILIKRNRNKSLEEKENVIENLLNDHTWKFERRRKHAEDL
ncbi:hypothetical protein HZS_2648 [Henneguya salminicola]|nr:hypothetical protein HZS_2648 [Henneguya salminicola]